MKKHWLFTTILAIAICIACFALFPAEVAAVELDDLNVFYLTFELNDDGKSYCVSECDKAIEGSLAIPAKYDSKPVTAIADAAFYECYDLEAVIIPDSIVNIGDSAFECTGLEYVSFGKGVRNVGANAFEFTYIDKVEIADLSAWLKINWGNSYAGPHGSKMFLNGKMLTKLVIPSDITIIKDFAFRGIDGIHTIIIHDKVTSIGTCAFYCCDEITTVDIGDGVKEIKDSAFGQCSLLKNLAIGKNVTKIGETAFYSCDSLLEVVVPSGITRIPEGMYSMSDNLEKITIGNNITCIGSEAFAHCSNLSSVVIPSSVKKIEWGVFSSCDNLRDIYFDGSKSDWENIDIEYMNEDLAQAKIHFTNPCVNGHSYDSWKKSNDSTHARTCSACSKTETAKHSWDNGSVTKSATCQETGIKTYSCTICKASKTEPTPKSTSHAWDSGVTTKAASCKEDGEVRRTCKNCGKTKTETVSKLNSHKYDDGTVLKEPTCKEHGNKLYTCEVCGEKHTVDTPKLTTHTPGEDATLTTPQKCTVCGIILKPALTPETKAPSHDITTQKPIPGGTSSNPGNNAPTQSNGDLLLVGIIGLGIGIALTVVVMRKKE